MNAKLHRARFITSTFAGRTLAAATGACLMLVAGNVSGQVMPPQAAVQGQTLGDHAGGWWQWVLAIEPGSNPVLDETGEFCHEGQEGKVFYLAGTFGGDVERHCTIDTGTFLFIPLLNSLWISTEPTDPQTAGEIREQLLPGFDGATVYCEIDGRAVGNLDSYFVESPLFNTSLVFFGLEGEFGPSMAMGYHVMLPPLSAGEHVIRFGANAPAMGDFVLNVTYQLTVVGGN